MAQVPLAQDAAPVDQGSIMITAGVGIGLGDMNDDTVLGVRGTYGAIENLLVSVDVGYMLDAEIMGASVAGQYALTMLELPVDLAARLALGLWDWETDTLALDIMGVVSKQIEQVDGLVLYGAVGFQVGIGDWVDEEVILAGGATYALPVENLDLFAELTYVDELAVAAGVRYCF